MSFLQPMLLAALPLAALPIIIHLINQRRYRTVRWAAMMFLVQANRMSRGYARIRHWLIMAARVLAIAALIFAVSRPLAGGWLGLAAGGAPDTTLVLVDRSPSMRQVGAGGGESKLAAGLRQLATTLATVGSSRWVLIESGRAEPRELESPETLVDLPETGPTDASADIPALLQAAQDYIRDTNPGRTEVWLLSDVRRNDWDPESGRWPALRDAFLQFPQGVRFHLLAYPEPSPGNLGILVDEARRRETSAGAELVVSLRVIREGGVEAEETVPVRFEIGGARSEVAVALTGSVASLEGHRIPLSGGETRGWGRVVIPADRNPADNDFWFTFDNPSPRHAVVVSTDPTTARPLELAASVSPDPALTCSAEVIAPEAFAAVDLDTTALLLWHAPLPRGDDASALRSYLDRGGRVIFFPPREPDDTEFLGVRWTSWAEGAQDVGVENWRGDEDLLAHTRGGTPLPLGELRVLRSCGLEGAVTPLATLRGGAPLLARLATGSGGVYFSATTPSAGDSSLATDGVALYVLVQRAMAAGAEALEGTRQLVAGGPVPGDPATWSRVEGAADALSTDYPLHAGVYQMGERLLAVNRPEAESSAPVMPDGQVAGLFEGLDFSRVDAQLAGDGSIVEEIFRVFLVAVLVAMVTEAALCLPNRRRRGESTP